MGVVTNVGEDRVVGSAQVLKIGADGNVTVPGGAWLLTADFNRLGSDLQLTDEAGHNVLIPDYFGSLNAPTLRTENGAVVNGSLASSLAGPVVGDNVYAQAGGGAADAGMGTPIGVAEKVDGTVKVTHPDGSSETLQPGASVYQGDVIVTGADGAIGINFDDDTVFSLGGNGRMTIDEMVYDGASHEGSLATTVMQGAFSFISGNIAHNNYDNMIVKTPVATIGVRGTKVVGNAAQEGEENSITLLPDPDGHVGKVVVFNEVGTVTLDQAGMTTTVTSMLQAPPIAPTVLPIEQIQQLYKSTLDMLPKSAAYEYKDNTDSNQPAPDKPDAPDGEQKGEAPPDGENTDTAQEEAPQDPSQAALTPEEKAALEEAKALAEAEKLAEEAKLAEAQAAQEAQALLDAQAQADAEGGDAMVQLAESLSAIDVLQLQEGNADGAAQIDAITQALAGDITMVENAGQDSASSSSMQLSNSSAFTGGDIFTFGYQPQYDPLHLAPSNLSTVVTTDGVTIAGLGTGPGTTTPDIGGIVGGGTQVGSGPIVESVAGTGFQPMIVDFGNGSQAINPIIDLLPAINPTIEITTPTTTTTTVAQVDTTTTTVAAPVSVSITVSGQVIDGYIWGATVFWDANDNGAFDQGEISTVTAKDGSFSLSLTGVSSTSTGSIIAYNPDGKAIDVDTKVPFNGKFIMPTEQIFSGLTGDSGGQISQVVITPLTSLVERGADQAAIKNSLGLNGIDPNINLLQYDPINGINANDADGMAILKANLQIANLIKVASTALVGAGVGVESAAADAVFTALVNSGDGSLNVGGFTAADLQAVVESAAGLVNAATGSQVSLSPADLAQIGSVLEAYNTLIANIDVNSPTAFSEMVNSSSLVQGSGATAIQAAVSTGNYAGVNQVVVDTVGSNSDLTDDATASTNDILQGLDGNDTITAHAGDDILMGDAGNDVLSAGDGADQLFGGTGNDQLDGGAGADLIQAGEGNDTIAYDAVDTTVDGGLGNDTLVVADAALDLSAMTNVSNVETLQFDAGTAVTVSADAVSAITGGGNTLTLDGTAATISLGDSSVWTRGASDGTYTTFTTLSSTGATITLHVANTLDQSAFNLGPTVDAAGSAAGNEDTAISGQITASDLNGDALTFAVDPNNAPANGTVTVNADGTYTYTPNANFNGADSFVVNVSDGFGGVTAQTITVNVAAVNDAPTIDTTAVAASEDSALNGQLQATDVDADTLTWGLAEGGQAANGTVVVNADGTYTYTPNADFNGADSFTVTVSDGNGGVTTQTVTVDVSPANDAPTVVANAGAAGAEDSVLTGSIQASDADGDALTFSLAQNGAPANGTVVVNADGTYTYTPNADFNGADSFTVSIADGNGGVTTTTVTVDVSPVNDAPTVVANAGAAGAEDTVLSGSIQASDVDGDALTFSLAQNGAPANGTVVVNADGTYTYTPNADFNGADSFTVSIADGNGGVTTTTVTVDVSPVNDAPTVVANAGAAGAEDSVLTGSIQASDADGDALTFSLAQNGAPANGTVVVNADGTYTYTPNADFNGADSFTVSIADGNGGVTTTTVTVDVSPVNDAPDITSDSSYTGDEGVDITGTITATDVDGDVLSFGLAQGGAPVNGTVVIDPVTGDFTYTPNADYNGTDTFTVTVSDGNGGVTTQTISVEVSNVNDAPDFGSAAVHVKGEEDEAISGQLQATDADGDALTYSLAAEGAPVNGTVVVNADGTYTYTPNDDFFGADSFTVTVADGRGGFDTQTVHVTVTPENDRPETDDGSAISVSEDGAVSGTIEADDVDNDALTFSLAQDGAPVNGTVVVNADGTYTYTPNADFFGADSFTVTVADGNGGVTTQTVSVEVESVNDAPVVTSDASVAGVEDADITGTITATDVDGGNLSFRLAQNGAPTNGAVTVNADGTYTYTPNADFFGADSFTVAVTDGNGGVTTQTISVEVAAVNDAPVITSDASVAGTEDADITGTITATDADGDVLTFGLAQNGVPANGSVVVDPVTGDFTYTPNADFFGADSFTVTVADGNGGVTTQTITVDVAPVDDNAAPILAVNEGITFEGDDDDLVTITSEHLKVTDSDNAPSDLVFTLTDIPDDGQLLINGQIATVGATFTQADVDNGRVAVRSDEEGQDSFSFTVSDGEGGVIGQTTFTMTVTDDDRHDHGDDHEDRGQHYGWDRGRGHDDDNGQGGRGGDLVLDAGDRYTVSGDDEVRGDLDMQDGSAIYVDIGGRHGDQLDVQGDAALRGVLDVAANDGHDIEAGDSFTVIRADHLSGAFDDINGLDVSDTIVLDATFTARGMTLTAHTATNGGQGTAANDTLEAQGGSAGRDILLGGSGNDTLLGDGGGDLLYGGAGDDQIDLGGMDFGRADGGDGADSILMSYSADMSGVENWQLDNIEGLDMTGGGANVVTLNADLINAMTNGGTNVMLADTSASNMTSALVVSGNQGDQLNLTGGNWSDSGQDVTINGANYSVYQSATGHGNVVVDNDVTVQQSATA